ncbi:PqiB family protein [Litoreibacter roseus]|uniref:Paraquat-inducible protein B n=1 Tax=Litoreibacter roseus TaxID=2601869 RepID=A0A6N6JI83_9RHOB|nr:MlaD family protein [Litoreibacter roseus]GFE66073.1 paraquat-inducible protein B [Litoreibacter roseus]
MRRPPLEPEKDLADLKIEDRPRPRLSRVWLLPLLAVVIALGIAWQNYQSRGPLIEIAFSSADGVEVGQTQLRYRDVSVGVVEDAKFSDDLSEVIISVRVGKQIAPFIDGGAQFWIVKPEVTTQGVSGLGTVLSGVYIEGTWDASTGNPQERFAGLESAPLIRPSEAGLRIMLRAREDVELVEGAPILLRGIEVGRVGRPRLSASGNTITVPAFISEPHDSRITSSTRFWDVSGFSLSLGTGGVTLDVDRLASLIQGGVSFQTMLAGGTPVSPGHVFELFPDEATARDSLFEDAAERTFQAVTFFEGSVAGLSEGATVRYRGIRVGEVENLSVIVEDDEQVSDVRLRTTLSLRPNKLGLPPGTDDAQIIEFLSARVAEGLRARVASDGLLGGNLVIELAELPDMNTVVLRRDEDGTPILPDAPAQTSSFAASAEGVFERINALPVEEMLESVIALLDNVNRVVGAEAMQTLPDRTVALLDDTRAIIASDDLRLAVGDLRRTSADIQKIVGDVANSQAVENLVSALERADQIASGLEDTSTRLPDLTQGLSDLVAKADALPLDALVASATDFVQTADAFFGADEAKDVPVALSGALEEVRQVLAALREGDAVSNLNTTLANADQAAAAISQAAADLPALSSQLNQTLASLNALAAAYGGRSRFNDDTLATLREVQEAAEAVSSLARAIERNPNSLLIGR